MGTTNDHERREKVIDAILALAIEEAVMQQIDDSTPSDEELERMYPRTAETDKRFYGLISTEFGASKKQRVFRTITRIAASFAAIFTFGSIILLSVEASRNFILNTVITVRDDHVAFGFGGANQPVIELQENDWAALYGFELTGFHEFDNQIIRVYENDNAEQLIFISYSAMSLDVAIDNEQRDFIVTRIGSREVYVFESAGEGYTNVMIWEDDSYVNSLVSSIPAAQFFAIAATFILD